MQSPGSLAATPLPQPSGRLILRSSELGPGKLVPTTDPIAVTTDLAGAAEDLVSSATTYPRRW